MQVLNILGIIRQANELLKPEYQLRKNKETVDAIKKEAVEKCDIYGESCILLESFKTINGLPHLISCEVAYTDVNDLMDVCADYDGESYEARCNLVLIEEGEEYRAHTVSICNRGLLFYATSTRSGPIVKGNENIAKGVSSSWARIITTSHTLDYVVDTVGFYHSMDLYSIESEEN